MTSGAVRSAFYDDVTAQVVVLDSIAESRVPASAPDRESRIWAEISARPRKSAPHHQSRARPRVGRAGQQAPGTSRGRPCCRLHGVALPSAPDAEGGPDVRHDHVRRRLDLPDHRAEEPDVSGGYAAVRGARRGPRGGGLDLGQDLGGGVRGAGTHGAGQLRPRAHRQVLRRGAHAARTVLQVRANMPFPVFERKHLRAYKLYASVAAPRDARNSRSPIADADRLPSRPNAPRVSRETTAKLWA